MAEGSLVCSGSYIGAPTRRLPIPLPPPARAAQLHPPHRGRVHARPADHAPQLSEVLVNANENPGMRPPLRPSSTNAAWPRGETIRTSCRDSSGSTSPTSVLLNEITAAEGSRPDSVRLIRAPAPLGRGLPGSDWLARGCGCLC